MSISQVRIKNAWEARLKWANDTDDNRDLEEVILAADAAFNHPPTPPPMTGVEPELPFAVARTDNGAYEFHGVPFINQLWKAHELRAIAAHMDYMENQRTREQEAAEITNKMCEVAEQAYWDCKDTVLSHEKPAAWRRAIKAALEAQRSEARKGD